MKTTLRTLIVIISLSLISKTASSQISVSSSNGYTVNISIQPVSIIAANGNSCQNGYTYKVKLNYSISYAGTNRPASNNGLYTLQGTIGCGSSSSFFDLPNGTGTGSTNSSNAWTSQTNCATATVASLACNTVTIQIEGPGISDRTITYTGALTIPLPVTLVNFNAETSKSAVQLTWTTATQIENDYFSIERSADGSNWSVINTVKGAGTSSALLNYSYTDANPVAGTSYYRLKQTDLDGKFTYSENKAVKFTGTTSISIFPVPNTGNTINFKGIAEPKNELIVVRDAAGVAVYSTTLSSNTVQLPNLAAGLYVISVKNKVTGEASNLRYVKI
jgi:hypothetical protein